MTPRVWWPPDMRVAPPPPDALPPHTWPRLRVTVVDPAGMPVAGAAVQVWVDGRGCIGRSFGTRFMRPDVVDSPQGKNTWLSGAAFTGADGVAIIRVPTGTATHVVARDATGRAAVSRQDRYDRCMMPCAWRSCGTCSEGPPCTYRREAGCGERSIDLRLQPPVTLVGRVFDENARPLPGTRVVGFPMEDFDRVEIEAWSDPERWRVDEWSRVASGPPHEAPVVTDSTGGFALQVVVPARLVLLAAAPGRPLASVAVDTEHPPRSIELRTGPVSRLALRVVDGAARPVEDTVFVGDQQVPFPADSTGHLVLAGLSARRHTVWVTANGFHTRRLALEPGEREVLVRLSPRPHVAVDVTAPRALVSSLGDRPLVDVRLVAPGDLPETHAVSEPRSGIVELAPDGSGTAWLEDVTPGDYTIWVTWRGGLVRGPRVRVPPAGIASSAVHLEADASLSGALRSRTAGQTRDVTYYHCLKLRHPTIPISTCASVDWTGRYSFPLVPAGRWEIQPAD